MIFKKAVYHEPVKPSTRASKGGRPAVNNSLRHQLIIQCGTLLVGECLQVPIKHRNNLRTYLVAANRELHPMKFAMRTGEKVVSVIRVA